MDDLPNGGGNTEDGFFIECEGGIKASITGEQARAIKKSGCVFFDNAFRHGTIEAAHRLVKLPDLSVATLRHIVELLCDGSTWTWEDRDQEDLLSKALDYIQADYCIRFGCNGAFDGPTSRAMMKIQRECPNPMFSFHSYELSSSQLECAAKFGLFFRHPGCVVFHNRQFKDTKSVRNSNCRPNYEVHIRPSLDLHSSLRTLCAVLNGSTEKFELPDGDGGGHNNATGCVVPIYSSNKIGLKTTRHVFHDDEQDAQAHLIMRRRQTRSISFDSNPPISSEKVSDDLRPVAFEGTPYDIFQKIGKLQLKKFVEGSSYVCLYAGIQNGFMLSRFLYECDERGLQIHVDPLGGNFSVRTTSKCQVSILQNMAHNLGNFRGETDSYGFRLTTQLGSSF